MKVFFKKAQSSLVSFCGAIVWVVEVRSFVRKTVWLHLLYLIQQFGCCMYTYTWCMELCLCSWWQCFAHCRLWKIRPICLSTWLT